MEDSLQAFNMWGKRQVSSFCLGVDEGIWEYQFTETSWLKASEIAECSLSLWSDPVDVLPQTPHMLGQERAGKPHPALPRVGGWLQHVAFSTHVHGRHVARDYYGLVVKHRYPLFLLAFIAKFWLE